MSSRKHRQPAPSSNGSGQIHFSQDDEDDSSESEHPPFLPLEEQNQIQQSQFTCSLPSGKTVVKSIMFSFIAFIIWDALWKDPQDRWLKPESSAVVLLWVQAHPLQGLVLILLVIAAAVVIMIPIGTPLTLGCGYIYKGAYGWKIGLTIATIVAMGGSALGAVTCFLLGRYLMREQVRKWIKKYPLFHAIDIGKSAECSLGFSFLCFLILF
jgi:hypothetical protein